MKRLFIMISLVLAFALNATSQVYITKNGKISFFSATSVENIDAVNNQAVSILNAGTGDIGFSVIIKGFLFKKALMQEHFNEDNMESDKFPKAIFKGVIADIIKVNFNKDGDYAVKVSGDMTMHGITQKIAVNATISIKAGKVSASSEFNLLRTDYKISMPKLTENNVSKSMRIKVACIYEPRK